MSVLREFLVQLFQRFFHGHKSPVCDRACVDGLRGFFPEQVCTNDAVNTVCAKDDVRGRRAAVLEMDLYGTVVLLVHDLVDAFVEVGALGGDAFDELVEEVGAVDALLAGGVFLGVDELAFVFAFALLVGGKGSVISRLARKIMDLPRHNWRVSLHVLATCCRWRVCQMQLELLGL